jgi:hypothetical protein
MLKRDIASISKLAVQRPSAADEAEKVSEQRVLSDALNRFVTKRFCLTARSGAAGGENHTEK